MTSLRLGLLASVALVMSVGCAAEHAREDVDSSSASSEAIVSRSVVVANSKATEAAIVEDGSVRLPLEVADAYRALVPGSIFVGARGDEKSRNPDGFLRRVEAVSVDGGELTITTSPATLTDAIVRGALQASSSGLRIDDPGSSDQALHVDSSSAKLQGIAIDFDDSPLYGNVDEVETPGGKARFDESIRIERGTLSARPTVDIDLRIEDGRVTRFLAMVEGNLDASIAAVASVTASGNVTPHALDVLKARPHQASRILYRSPAIPLPTLSVGRVPVSPSVSFTVTLRCDLAFAGPVQARAGVDAKSYVRLGGLYEHGGWGQPIRSEFAITPSFEVLQGGEASAKCALETQAELAAYGVGGVAMSVSPWVDFAVTPHSAALEPSSFRYHAEAGASGAMRARADVFGLAESDLDRPLVEWKAPSSLDGSSR